MSETPTEPQTPEPVELEPENFETADANDEEDVPAALQRNTDDGPGFENETELPAEDFDSFAEPDVEQEDNA